MEEMVKVTVWGKANCPQCEATVRVLNKKKIPFEYKDITDHPDKMSAFKRMGFMSAPIVETDNRRWSGFRPDLLSEFVKFSAETSDNNNVNIDK